MLHGTHTHLELSNHSAASSSARPESPVLHHAFIGVSSSLRRLLLQAEITAPRLHLATLEGEAGTGKHLFAQTLHRLTEFAAFPFHRRDAREWLANETDISHLSGTLYLDRVDLLAPVGQNLLLSLIKILQNETHNETRNVAQNVAAQRFLLLASTHASLRQMASHGGFLPDLAFRLTAVRFSIPPLREHREDIAPLAQALIDRICRRYQQPTAVLAPGTLPHLLQHSWPGNVRELASALESAILDSSTGILRPSDLLLQHTHESFPGKPTQTASVREAAAPLTAGPLTAAPLTLDDAIRQHIQMVLDLNRGNKLRAARQLGISRSTLYRLLASSTPSQQTSLPR